MRSFTVYGTKTGEKPRQPRPIGFRGECSSSGPLAIGGLPDSELPSPTQVPVPTPVSQTQTLNPQTEDLVENPPHYARLSPQPIQVSVDWDLKYLPATALKYLARAGFKKGVNAVDDYRKAVSYINREIARLQRKKVT